MTDPRKYEDSWSGVGRWLVDFLCDPERVMLAIFKVGILLVVFYAGMLFGGWRP